MQYNSDLISSDLPIKLLDERVILAVASSLHEILSLLEQPLNFCRLSSAAAADRRLHSICRLQGRCLLFRVVVQENVGLRPGYSTTVGLRGSTWHETLVKEGIGGRMTTETIV